MNIDVDGLLGYCYFFFFKQKTAYELRISDWSSDVCSSDLFGDAQNVIRLTKPHAARAEQAQRQLGFVEGPPQNVCGIEESPVDRDQAKLISHRCDHCGKAAPILPLPYDRLRIEAKVGRCRIKTPSMKIGFRSEEHTSELQSLMRISYAVFCLKKKKQIKHN